MEVKKKDFMLITSIIGKTVLPDESSSSFANRDFDGD